MIIVAGALLRYGVVIVIILYGFAAGMCLPGGRDVVPDAVIIAVILTGPSSLSSLRRCCIVLVVFVIADC